MVYSTDRSKAVVPALVLLFVALWFILRGDLFYVLPYVILFLCFSVLLAVPLPRFILKKKKKKKKKKNDISCFIFHFVFLV